MRRDRKTRRGPMLTDSMHYFCLGGGSDFGINRSSGVITRIGKLSIEFGGRRIRNLSSRCAGGTRTVIV